LKEQNTILKQIAQLPRLSFGELQERWRALFGSEPPAYNKVFLIKRLAHRIQELAYGGLSESAKARLKEFERESGESALTTFDRPVPRKKGMPVIGTRLVREWNGGRYEVTVVHDGFEFQGRTFRSLTAISKAITGVHWNGPAFFGLRRDGNGKGSK
jgi:hypothetical protein